MKKTTLFFNTRYNHIRAAGYDPVPVDDRLLPSHNDQKVDQTNSSHFGLEYFYFFFRVLTTARYSPMKCQKSKNSLSQFSNSKSLAETNTKLITSKY